MPDTNFDLRGYHLPMSPLAVEQVQYPRLLVGLHAVRYEWTPVGRRNHQGGFEGFDICTARQVQVPDYG